MLWGHVAKCCCGGSDKIWSASRCFTNSCQNDPCTTCSPTCPPTVTFCDAYRASIGLPPALDPAFCYFVVVGGCIYVVTGFTTGTCSPTPTLTHNSAALYGIYPAPAIGGCSGLCGEVAGSGHTVAFEPFDGGIPCGTPFTVTANWSGVYCNGECDPPISRCIKEINTVVFEWKLDAWPTTAVSLQTKCDDASRQCAECVEIDPSGSLPNQYNASDQIGDNYCNELFPTADPCDDVGIDFGPGCTLYATLGIGVVSLPSPPPAVAALTITRSCDCGGGGWISGTPESGIVIEGCYFAPDPCGTTVEAFADKINAVLGKQSATCLATYTATATACAHVGYGQLECPATNCSGVLDFTGGPPYVWSGPVFSGGYCTATYYAQAVLGYELTLGITSFNYTRLDPDDVCRCLGSLSLGISATYVSNIVAIQCNQSVVASDFTFTQTSGPACCTVPTIA
jgi:hypothetical protein